MNHLEMPDSFTSFSIQCRKTVGEQVIARPVTAVTGRSRRAQGNINNAEFIVNSYKTDSKSTVFQTFARNTEPNYAENFRLV